MMGGQGIGEWFRRRETLSDTTVSMPSGSHEDLSAMANNEAVRAEATRCVLAATEGIRDCNILDVVVFTLHVGFVLGQQATEERELERVAQL